MSEFTIPLILEQPKKLGTVAVNTPDGVAYIKPDGPGRWSLLIVEKTTVHLSRTDAQLKALLIRWGYTGEWPERS